METLTAIPMNTEWNSIPASRSRHCKSNFLSSICGDNVVDVGIVVCTVGKRGLEDVEIRGLGRECRRSAESLSRLGPSSSSSRSRSESPSSWSSLSSWKGFSGFTGESESFPHPALS